MAIPCTSQHSFILNALTKYDVLLLLISLDKQLGNSRKRAKKVGKIVSYFPAQIRPSVHTSLDFSLRWSGGECLGTRRSSLFKLCTPSELESATITKTRQEKQDTVGQKERENNA